MLRDDVGCWLTTVLSASADLLTSRQHKVNPALVKTQKHPKTALDSDLVTPAVVFPFEFNLTSPETGRA
jgi:hypothetical protein